MKTSKKFLLVTIGIVCLLTVASVWLIDCRLDAIRVDSNEATWKVIALVKKNNSEISDTQIAEILNGATDTAEVKKAFEDFGIKEDSWAQLENENNSRKLLISVGGICLAEFLVLLSVFGVYYYKRKKEMDAMTTYMMRLNSGIYSLDMEENSEDDESLLKNQIYKTTVMLREQRENSLQDKIALKDSLADISHQLKTPLTSIVLMVETILADEDMPVEVRTDFLKDIRRSAGNISSLVQSLLVLSKFDANTMELKKKEENVKSLLGEVEQNIAILAEVKGVELICECEPEVRVFCDRKWAIEAISNVVKNCVEHTDEGGKVSMSAEENKLYTKLVITDTGVGISKEDLPHIFERFYKGKNSSKDSVGIGLALAKTLIEKNDGFIRVDSECGKGTTFTIQYFHQSIFGKKR